MKVYYSLVYCHNIHYHVIIWYRAVIVSTDFVVQKQILRLLFDLKLLDIYMNIFKGHALSRRVVN